MYIHSKICCKVKIRSMQPPLGCNPAWFPHLQISGVLDIQRRIMMMWSLNWFLRFLLEGQSSAQSPRRRANYTTVCSRAPVDDECTGHPEFLACSKGVWTDQLVTGFPVCGETLRSFGQRFHGEFYFLEDVNDYVVYLFIFRAFIGDQGINYISDPKFWPTSWWREVFQGLNYGFSEKSGWVNPLAFLWFVTEYHRWVWSMFIHTFPAANKLFVSSCLSEQYSYTSSLRDPSRWN